MSILLPACAKVNLALEVGPRLCDGYHQVRTVFQAIDLCDLVLMELSPDLAVTCGWPGVPEGEANLAYRAARSMRDMCGHSACGVRVQLFKAIPPAAGLGGGSSDAAATLRGLTWLWKARLPPAEMVRVAAELGSDVPFFLTGGTALGEGRGDRCESLPGLPDCPLVVVCPPRQVATAEVYRLWDSSPRRPVPEGKGVEAVRSALGRGDLAGVAGALWNDLRAITEYLVPEVGEVRELLMGCGALGTEMSGSGPAVFGIFPSVSAAYRAVVLARGRGHRAFLCRPMGRWALYPGEGDFS
ncbi:MAG: 4-(cytidine 5'-diphospho)-2-C-methyl-D-erythritol kinase [Bacillota bacterium]